MTLLYRPVIFRQLSPLPPHSPHLSRRRLEPITRSQPALAHWPWTHTEVVSGPQAVPSITCGKHAPISRGRRAEARRGGKPYLGLKDLELAAASGPAEELAPVSRGDAGVLGDPFLHVPVVVQVGGAVVPLALLLPEALGWGEIQAQSRLSATGWRHRVRQRTHRCGRGRPVCCTSGTAPSGPRSTCPRSEARGRCTRGGRTPPLRRRSWSSAARPPRRPSRRPPPPGAERQSCTWSRGRPPPQSSQP